MKQNFYKLAVVAMMVLIITSPVLGALGDIEGWEDDDYDYTWVDRAATTDEGITDSFVLRSGGAYDGNRMVYIGATYFEQGAETDILESDFTAPTDKPFKADFYFTGEFEDYAGTSATRTIHSQFHFGDSWVRVRHEISKQANDEPELLGNVENVTQVNPSPVQFAGTEDPGYYDDWYHYEIIVNPINNTVTLKIDDITVLTGDITVDVSTKEAKFQMHTYQGAGGSSTSTNYYGYWDNVRVEQVTETVSGTITNQTGDNLSGVPVEIENDSGAIIANQTTDQNGTYSFSVDSGNYTITAKGQSIGYTTESQTVSVQNDTTVNFQLEQLQEELEIEVQKWMYPNTTQTYKGIFVPENGYDIVTSELNVTSDNTSVIQVNEANNTLIAQSGVNNTANVTFKYQHLSVTKEIAVSHRTLANIHFLPSTQWFNAIMGIDDPQTEFGLGSEIQWIFVAILLSSLLASLGNSEWIGLGSIIMSMSLLWMLDYVSLGMVLATLFFGLFLAFTLLDIPRNEHAEITVEDNNPK